jgi:hypothetical protein
MDRRNGAVFAKLTQEDDICSASARSRSDAAGDAGEADFACGRVLLNGYSVVKGPRRRKNACCTFLTCRVAGDDGSGADVVEM